MKKKILAAAFAVLLPVLAAAETATETFTPTATKTPGPNTCLLDDCEDNDHINKFFGSWFTYRGGHGTMIVPTPVPDGGGDFSMTAGGYDGSLYAAGFTGTVGTQSPDYPLIGMCTQLNAMAGAPPAGTGQVMDISSCTGVRFYTKGDGKQYHIKVPYTNTADQSLTGYNDYRYDFAAPATWTLVDAPFSIFAQAIGWGTTFPLAQVLSNAKAFQFQTSFYATAGTTTASLLIDNLYIYGCAVTCPELLTPPPTSTPTNTYTITETLTPTDTFTVTGTFTRTGTFTQTNTFTVTNTFTQTRTFTVTGTVTQTRTYTATPTQTAPAVSTATETAVNTPAETVTPRPAAEVKERDSLVYPTIGRDRIKVAFNINKKSDIKIYVYSISGELVKVFSYNAGAGREDNNYKIDLDVSKFAPGIYYYTIQGTAFDGEIINFKSKKFMIKR